MTNPNIAATETFLNFIHAPGALIEVRGLGSNKGIVRHLNRDTHALSRSAHAMEAIGASVFYSLNPIDPDSLYAKYNTTDRPMRRAKHTARDKDILHRTTYLIDIDPDRPSGTASTDEEKDAAYTTVSAVRDYLSTKGWPDPIMVDSGNGYHLLYRGDQAAATSPLWPFVLRGLADKFDDEHAHVDVSVHNAARISRLPGTLNTKGDNTPDRPHRRAEVLKYPATWTPVSHGQHIYALAHDMGFHTDRANKSSRKSAAGLLIDHDGVMRLIAEFDPHLSFSHLKETEDMDLFILDSCPFAGRPHRGSGEKTALTLSSTSLGFRCMSDDCEGKGWQDLKRHLHDLTGRWPKEPIYEMPEDVVPLPLLQGEYRLKKSVEWQYDAETYAILESAEYQSREWPTDPAAWGLTWSQIRHAAYRECKQLIADAPEENRVALEDYLADHHSVHHVIEAGRLLGADYLFVLSRHLKRPKSPEVWRFVSNGEWDRVERQMWGEPVDLHAFIGDVATRIDYAHIEASHSEAGVRNFC